MSDCSKDCKWRDITIIFSFQIFLDFLFPFLLSVCTRDVSTEIGEFVFVGLRFCEKYSLCFLREVA